MSKISVSSPAAGTATYTISAPTGSTDRTLSLPDQTATLITNSADVLNIGSGQFYKDASGNVGIGTSSPATALSVQNVRSDTAGTGWFTYTASATSGRRGMRVDTSNGYWFDYYNGSTWSAQMGLDSSGNLLVGTTARFDSSFVGVVCGLNANNGLVIKNTDSFGGNFCVFDNSAGANAGKITHTGTTTVAYTTSSDYRLKEDVKPMTGALAKVAALKPVTYKWKVDGSDGQGFIAHELQEVEPGCVTGEKDAVDSEGKPQYQGIDTSFLVATLTAAIQELKAIVDAQGAEIAALKGTA